MMYDLSLILLSFQKRNDVTGSTHKLWVERKLANKCLSEFYIFYKIKVLFLDFIFKNNLSFNEMDAQTPNRCVSYKIGKKCAACA